MTAIMIKRAIEAIDDIKGLPHLSQGAIELIAEVVIKSMRNPTDAMLQPNACSFDDSLNRLKIWQDMIDEALK